MYIMRTIRTKVFKFEELNETAQQTAIEDQRSINVDYEWWESIYEDAKNIGLKITGFNIDRNRHAEGEFINDAYFTASEILDNHGEECETYKTAKKFINIWNDAVKRHSDGIDFEKVDYNKADDFDEYIEDAEDDFKEQILEDYAIMLQNQYDYLQTDEAVKETILANDYEFLKSGKMYN